MKNSTTRNKYRYVYCCALDFTKLKKIALEKIMMSSTSLLVQLVEAAITTRTFPT